MKKFASILLVAAMALSLVACGGGDSSTAGGSSAAAGGSSAAAGGESKGKIAYVVGNLGDKSFSDSGEAGMNILREEGWEVKTVETGDASKADKYEDYILDVLDQGYEYIVASSTYMEIMAKLAPDYPEVKFVGFDDNWGGRSSAQENMTWHLLCSERGLLPGWHAGRRHEQDRHRCG